MAFLLYDPSQLRSLHSAFSLAFKGYSVPFNTSENEFTIRIEQKLNLNNKLSGLWYEQGQPVGFVLHASSTYEGMNTVYNGGTGVIPDFRRKGIVPKIYEELLPRIKKTGANRILLEVITSNHLAIRLYERLGFQYRRTFKCFNGTINQQLNNPTVELSLVDSWNPIQYLSWKDYQPSFIDSDRQIPFNWTNERLIEARIDQIPVGFVLFQPLLGRISQLAVHPSYREKGIGHYLLKACLNQSEKSELTMLNIPEEQENMIQFLQACGLENQLDQYEMEMLI